MRKVQIGCRCVLSKLGTFAAKLLMAGNKIDVESAVQVILGSFHNNEVDDNEDATNLHINWLKNDICTPHTCVCVFHFDTFN